MQKLNDKHRLFIEAYDGNAEYAAQIAGIDPRKANQLLTEPLIMDAIKERSRYLKTLNTAIATRQERQAFWTNLMRNEDPYRKDELDANNMPVKKDVNLSDALRIKASELLGKSEQDFVDKIDMTTTHTISDLVLASYKDPNSMSIEELEATYLANRKKKPDVEGEATTLSSIEDIL